MGNKLYIGNLSYSVNSSDLEEHFSTVGKVQSAQVITERGSGRSKGFGFVEMANEEEAAKCIEKLHGSSLLNRSISVSEARPMAPRSMGETGSRSHFRSVESRGRF